MEELTIGKLAKVSGVGVETVRFYERKGLIQQPKKLGGFRKYSQDDAVKIRFIKRAQELGFTLKEVEELLQLRVKSDATCKNVKKKTDTKIEEIKSKVSDLNKMLRVLKQLSAACGGSEKPTSECPILECFEKGGKC